MTERDEIAIIITIPLLIFSLICLYFGIFG